MKILITSDTHGIYSSISDYIINEGDIDLLIHAGDGVEDCKYISYETGINYYVVKGNNDFYSNESYEKVIDVEGYKIFLTHGHKYSIDFSLTDLTQAAMDNDCDMVIFGHIHRYINTKRSGIWLLNPGSPSLARDDDSGFLIMTIDKDIKIERIKTN